jgi:hypothetical protein
VSCNSRNKTDHIQEQEPPKKPIDTGGIKNTGPYAPGFNVGDEPDSEEDHEEKVMKKKNKFRELVDSENEEEVGDV